MKWEEVRQQYPHQWLLVEAAKADPDSEQHLQDEIAVIGTFSDSVTAMQSYAQLHQAPSERALYVCHTAQSDFEMTKRNGVALQEL